MRVTINIILLFFLASNLFGLPRFALMEDVNCSSCHQYSGGGAARSYNGKDFVRESLAMKDIPLPWRNEESESPFSFGFDTRYQFVSKSGEDLRHFPMQFALYAGAELGSFIVHG